MRTVYAVGSKVCVASDIEATVMWVRLGAGLEVSYLVAWWSNGERKEEWVHDFEVLGAPEGSTWNVEP